MKILLLFDCNSVHTIKWATSLASRGLSVSVFSLNKCKVTDYDNFPFIEIYDNDTVNTTRIEGAFNKIKYLKVLPRLKKIIKKTKPDIVHAHYASSYGFLGSLCFFYPFVLSVWGADVFSFPRKSFLHKQILKFNLNRADKILSTSHIMANETSLYTDKKIEVTPFGIDLNKFKPQKGETLFKDNDIVLGTIKTLEEKYGIRYLINSFKIVSDKYKHLPLKLLIVGGGSLKDDLKRMTKYLDIEKKVIFTGKVPFEKIPLYHNMLSIYVSLSIFDSESFGVAIIEASACEKPVIVSDVGGLPEVVAQGVTGIVVPNKNISKIVEAMEKLIIDEQLRINLGKAGRERVRDKYNWNDNLQQMISIYKKLL